MCGKCVYLHKINIKNVRYSTFPALKTGFVCLKEVLLSN